MPSGIEVTKQALDDLKKSRNICFWQKKKMPKKHMLN